MTDRLSLVRRFVRARAALVLLSFAGGMAACNGDDGVRVTPGDFDPEILDVRPAWLEEGWIGRDPLGTPAVQLVWELPENWDGEVFRIYSRRSGAGNYLLVATVTSCAAGQCVYTDTNVEAGRSYDYFVAALDERSGDEVGESEAWSVTVPQAAQPTLPTGVSAIPLDGAIYLTWASTGAEKYRVFLEGIDQDSVFFELGATDGIGFLDSRTDNGTRYAYRVAAVDENGFVSRRSESAAAIPRPDYHAELIYALADSAQASGFRFTESEDEAPILAGVSTEAQWRLESVGGELQIVPRGGTLVTEGIFTTDLSCGPGSEADCEHISQAPAQSAFAADPVAVQAGNTYVFQVTVNGQAHFGKVRVQGDAVDSAGHRVVIFDWAYQLVANEPSLNLSPVAP